MNLKKYTKSNLYRYMHNYIPINDWKVVVLQKEWPVMIDHLIPAGLNPTQFCPPQGNIFELKIIHIDG